jgi:hypothetical protein
MSTSGRYRDKVTPSFPANIYSHVTRLNPLNTKKGEIKRLFISSNLGNHLDFRSELTNRRLRRYNHSNVTHTRDWLCTGDLADGSLNAARRFSSRGLYMLLQGHR